MRYCQTHEDCDERLAELSARVNLTTALLAHTEAHVARQAAEIERLTKLHWKRRLTAPARLLMARISSSFR